MAVYPAAADSNMQVVAVVVAGRPTSPLHILHRRRSLHRAKTSCSRRNLRIHHNRRSHHTRRILYSRRSLRHRHRSPCTRHHHSRHHRSRLWRAGYWVAMTRSFPCRRQRTSPS